MRNGIRQKQKLLYIVHNNAQIITARDLSKYQTKDLKKTDH
jgi:hypothetical protein